MVLVALELLLQQLQPQPLKRPSDSRSRSGTLSLSGLGILLWITVRSVGTILWISVLSVKLIKPVPLARNVLLLGGFATMHSTSTALADGSRLVKCVHWITVSGSFRSMVTRTVETEQLDPFSFCCGDLVAEEDLNCLHLYALQVFHAILFQNS